MEEREKATEKKQEKAKRDKEVNTQFDFVNGMVGKGLK